MIIPDRLEAARLFGPGRHASVQPCGCDPARVAAVKTVATDLLHGSSNLLARSLLLFARTPIRPKRRDQVMLNWKEYKEQIAAHAGQIGKTSPDIVRGYRMLSDAGERTNKLDPKTRELIALAVAVTLQCDGCITVHTEAAVRRGASREEIIEALGVATGVNAGAALVYSTRVMDALQAYTGSSSTQQQV
jgi:AhpD family alkylhydroperoxidase